MYLVQKSLYIISMKINHLKWWLVYFCVLRGNKMFNNKENRNISRGVNEKVSKEIQLYCWQFDLFTLKNHFFLFPRKKWLFFAYNSILKVIIKNILNDYNVSVCEKRIQKPNAS